MSVFKNDGNGTWYTMVRYTSWKGERKQKCKRGFATRKEALDWEREFLQQQSADMDMTWKPSRVCLHQMLPNGTAAHRSWLLFSADLIFNRMC